MDNNTHNSYINFNWTTIMAHIRTTDTWATRDTDQGKLEYNRYINPLCDYNYACYMRSKQIIADEYRRWDNRQKWLWSESLYDSLCRHMEIIKLLMKWHMVFEYKEEDGSVQLVVDPLGSREGREQKNLTSELNAIRFNSEGLKLDILLGRFEPIELEWDNKHPLYMI